MGILCKIKKGKGNVIDEDLGTNNFYKAEDWRTVCFAVWLDQHSHAAKGLVDTTQALVAFACACSMLWKPLHQENLHFTLLCFWCFLKEKK